MLNKWAPAPVAKPAVVARAVANAPAKADKQKVAILRRKELGNNCEFIADAYDDGMEIVTPDIIKKDGLDCPLGYNYGSWCNQC